MAPKNATVASSAAPESLRTRSSSKAGSFAPGSSAAGNSGVSKVAVTASKRNSAAPPGTRGAAGGGAASASSKAGKLSAKSQKSTTAVNVLSPPPVIDLQSQFNRASSDSAPQSDIPSETLFLSMSDETWFTEIASRIPKFERFRSAWLQSGSLDPNTMAMAYDPQSFVQDIQTDIDNLDRPTAHKLAVFVMDKFARCDDLPLQRRREWAAAWSIVTQKRHDIPGLELYHVDDSNEHSEVENVDIIDTTNSARELRQFESALSSDILNSETVFGIKAGFTVVPHDQILQALQEQASAASGANSGPVRFHVTWSRLSRWDRSSWHEFERKWWNCVNQSVQNGQYIKMLNLIDADLFNDIQQDLKIPSAGWFQVTEIDFLRKAHGKFGPVNKEVALVLLADHYCADTSRVYAPEQFANLLSDYNTKFLRTIDLEIAPSITKWPRKGEAKYGPLSLKSIRKAFQHGFNKFKSTSLGCAHCYDVCEQNPHLSHQELYQELRAHFLFDADALKRRTLHDAVSLFDKRSDGGSARGRSDGGSVRGHFDNDNRGRIGRSHGGSNKRLNNRRSPDRSPDRPYKKSASEFAIVQGKDRCWCCGDYTNHYGAGCSAETCLIFGTKWAKKQGYVWKSSDKEPKVNVPADDYQELRSKKKQVVRRNATDRVALRSNKSDANCHVPSVCVDVLPPVSQPNPCAQYCQFKPIYLSHDGSETVELPAFPVNIDVAVVTNSAPDQRFFGIAAFQALTSSVNVDNRPRLSLHFCRDVTSGPYKRRPRLYTGCVSASAHFNAISLSAVSHLSNYGKLKRLDTVATQRPEPLSAPTNKCALLSFRVELHNNLLSPELTEWFLLDPALPEDTVMLNSDFLQQPHMDSVVLSPAKLPHQGDISQSVRSVHRVLFDSGAQMSCVSADIAANHVILERKSVNVAIVQMGNVIARCHESVLMQFELFDPSLRPKQYAEWFLVWNNPYGIILGADFCNEFISWHSKLAAFTSTNAAAVLGTAASELPTSNPWYPAKAFSKTDNKTVANTKRQFHSRHPVTHRELRHRDAGKRPQLPEPSNHQQFRKPVLLPGIFTESARREPESLLCQQKEKRLMTIIDRIPTEHRVAFDVAELQHECIANQFLAYNRILEEIRGLPEGLKMHGGSSAIVKRSHLFEPHQLSSQLLRRPTPEVAMHTTAMNFLLDKAMRCGTDAWSWSSQDEDEYTARLADPRNMRNTPAGAAGAAVPTIADSFVNGATVTFVHCVRLQHFNGLRGRLYALQDDGRWQVRVLGKNQGQFVLVHPKNIQIDIDQRKFVSSADANFHSVGIDDGGMPMEDVEDAPRPVHRQFGKAYSAALTARIQTLLAKYKELFNNDISEPCDFEAMDIVLKPNAVLPSRARYYKNTPAMREEVRRQVQEQLSMGIIEKSQSPVVSNVLLVKRPHMPGRYRFVVDYQKVNDATVPDQLMMPDIKSQHDRLANKQIFGAVDISSYYRLINLKASCRYLTAFATDEGVYVYNRVAMGLRNACSHAQRVLQDALAADPVLGTNGANIRNYFDDIAWGSATEDEFMTVLEALMEFGIKHKLKYNLEKSCFGVDSITHVGFIANKDGIKIDPERTRDIVELEAPRSTKKVQSILGVLNFVRNFIPQFSVKAKFLTDRLEKSAIKRDSKTFVWSPEDAAAFAELKRLVLTAPLLSVLDYSQPIHIRCDSSRFGCGAVLFQFDDQGRELPVCYASRKYTPSETRYSTFQQEMGAVVWALERFLEYTQGYKVIVETDHRNIAYVKRSVMPQLARWRMRLEAFDFDVHYRCGPQQEVADGLSRSAVDDIGIDDVAVHYSDVLPERAMANAAPSIALAPVQIDAVNCSAYDNSCSATRVAWQTNADNVFIDPMSATDADTDSASEHSDNNNEDAAVAVPDAHTINRLPLDWTDAAAVRVEIEKAHNDLVGHGGVLVTLQRMLRRVAPNPSRKLMLQNIDAFCRGCPGCQKMRKRSTHSAVHRRVIRGNPFEELSVDIVTLPFPDALGNRYVVTVVDNFSHWVSVYACGNKSAVCAARALIQHIGVFGVPLRIRSDGGGEFVNDILLQLRRLIDCEHVVVHPYLHSANGIAERANRAILDKLRFMLFDRRLKNKSRLQWSDLLPFAQRIVNASFHSAIGASPAQLIFGGNLDLDRCILARPSVRAATAVPSYIDELSDAQFILFEAAEEHQTQTQAKIIAKVQRANVGKPERVFTPNDLVLVLPLKDAEKGTLGKLAPTFKGPFEVESVDGDFLWVVDPVSNKRVRLLARQCELWDDSIAQGIEGARVVAETDGFEFAVDAIVGHGFGNRDEPQNVVQLPESHRRVTNKSNYWFAVKWTGYERPTWVPYKIAAAIPFFVDYARRYPLLKM